MRWKPLWWLTLPVLHASPGYPEHRKAAMRQLIRNTWNDAFEAYMQNAFPLDELRPLSCNGLGHDSENPANWGVNDICGNFALTLLDSLDAFVIMRNHTGFELAVRKAIQYTDFNQDVKIQIFEVNIRVLGGLISAHLLASEPRHGFVLHWYRGELLVLAKDLAKRLLPAFTHSKTGIPFARVNLKTGLAPDESTETCAAAAGSLLLEFVALSRITGDPYYERMARNAFFGVWNRKSDIDLIGNTINVQTGNWIYGVSSVGAGIDSMFEYMLKSYIMLGELEYWRVWDDAYTAVMKHVRSPEGFWYRSVNMNNGLPTSHNVDSLAAFWPGLQVLAGDVDSAIKSHAVFANIWTKYGGLPEVFSTVNKQVEVAGYPLRPELIESTLFLYQATNDDSYLRFGERAILDIINRTSTGCGLAGLQDVRTGALDDRMHSFALSETLKYGYLIFDERNSYNLDDSNTVYTTEGHMIPLSYKYLSKGPHSVTSQHQLTCTAYSASNTTSWTPLLQGIQHRVDADYARHLAGLELDHDDMVKIGIHSIYGTCSAPVQDDFLLDVIFAKDALSEDTSPAPSKVQHTKSGLFVKSVNNIRLQLIRKQNPPRYEISKVGNFRVPLGTQVSFAEKHLFQSNQFLPNPLIQLHFSASNGGSMSALGHAAAFGPQLAVGSSHKQSFYKESIELAAVPEMSGNRFGCEPYSLPLLSYAEQKAVVVLFRGNCTFVQKMFLASQAGARGVLVINSDEHGFTPSSGANEDNTQSAAAPIPLMLISNTIGTSLQKSMEAGKVYMQVAPMPSMPPQNDRHQGRMLINGLEIANAIFAQSP